MRGKFKALKAGTNVSMIDDGQTVTISVPNVYTKAETETALALKAMKADVYIKTETENALLLKTNKADVYTKTDINDELAFRALKSDVCTKTESDTSLALKANKSGPTFTGVVTAVNLVVTQDIALAGNLVANGTGKTITFTNLTAEGNLTVSQASTFAGPMAVNSTLSFGNIQPSGTAGLNMLKLDGSSAFKIFATGTSHFFKCNCRWKFNCFRYL